MASLLPTTKLMFLGNDGNPLVGGKLFTFDSGTNTPRPTYSDAAGITPNTNPIVLDARGEALVFWNGSYRVRLEDPLGNVIWTVDSVAELITSYRTSSNGSVIVPFGTSVQRDIVPQLGYFRYNTDFDRFEGFNSGGWKTLANSTDVPPILRNTHNGFIMSTAGGSGTMTIGQGQCMNSTNTFLIDMPAPLNKTEAAFVEGDGVGGLDTGTATLSAVGATCSFATTIMTCTVAPTQGSFAIGQVINGEGLPANTVITSFGTGSGGIGTYNLSTTPGTQSARTCSGLSWYHFHVIRRPDTGAVDVLCSRSATAPTMPASYTQSRWIGAGLMASSGLTWVKFIQVDDRVLWSVPIVERDSLLFTGFQGVTTPPQVRTLGYFGLNGAVAASSYGAHLHEPGIPSLVGNSTSGLSVAGYNATNSYGFGGRTEVRTDLGSRVVLLASNFANLSLATFGYNIAEAKGRNA